jgi:response regulator NasT
MTAPKRVLIAEDEALIRLDLSEMLAEEGFDVVGQAVDGEQAVTMATALRPDLVIMDVKMPKKDGIDAAAEIVGEQIAPVVILTAFSQRELIERARDAGAMAYLVKPFSKSDLLPAIELAVARYAETTALRAEVADISQRLEARKVIDRAKGLLMTHQKMTEPEAFRWIQRTAMDRRTSMQAVANAVLEGLSAKSLACRFAPFGGAGPGRASPFRVPPPGSWAVTSRTNRYHERMTPCAGRVGVPCRSDYRV